MKKIAIASAIIAITLVFITVKIATAQEPLWAFGQTTPQAAAGAAPAGGARGAAPAAGAPAAGARGAAPAPDPTPQRVAGSDREFTRAQITDMFNEADWFPNDHPPMPEVVAKGRRPDVRRCSFCHLSNGRGRAENASLMGLPASYIIQTLNDYKSDLRKTAEPRKANTAGMFAIAKGMTDQEMKDAADYFASMKWTEWIKVVETDTIPKMRIAGVFLPAEGTEKEPLGQRIVETPNDPQAFQFFNPRPGWTAYVPVGSIKKGEELATKGMGKTVQCSLCHGAGLKGLGPVPSLAGRSPSYMARQLWDMQQGARKGVWTDLMKSVVENLKEEDILNITAYAASLKP